MFQIGSIIAEKYSPNVAIEMFPQSPIPQSEVQINATVFDDFGDISEASLSYSLNNWTWNFTEMDIIWGDQSNGTFLWAEWQSQDRTYPKDGSIIRPDGTLIEGNNRSNIMFPWNNNNDGNPTIESVLNHHKLNYRYDTEQQ